MKIFKRFEKAIFYLHHIREFLEHFAQIGRVFVVPSVVKSQIGERWLHEETMEDNVWGKRPIIRIIKELHWCNT
jgi:hypothetical protein